MEEPIRQIVITKNSDLMYKITTFTRKEVKEIKWRSDIADILAELEGPNGLLNKLDFE